MNNRKVRGEKLDLAAFQGENREFSSMPSSSGASGGFEQQRGQGYQREERQPREDAGPSRADEASAWRRSADGPSSSSSSRGFDRRDDRRDDRSGGFGRGGGRFESSGPRESGDARFSSRDGPSERPAHLRFRRGGDEGDRPRRPAAIEDGEEGEKPAEPEVPRWIRPPRESSESESTAPRDVDPNAEWRSHPRSSDRFGGGGGFNRGPGRFERQDERGDQPRPSRFGGDRGFGGDRSSAANDYEAAREARFAAREREREGDNGGGRFSRPPADERPNRFERSGEGGGYSRDSRPDRYRSGDSRYDSRPSEMDPLPSAPAHKMAAKREAAHQQHQQKKEEPQAEKVVKAVERQQGAFADNLHVPVVPVSQKVTALERAMADRDSIDSKDLSESLSRIQLDDEETIQSAGDVLARSIIEGKIALKEMLQQAKEKQPAHAQQLLTQALASYKQKKSDRELLALVQAAGVSVIEFIAPNLDKEKLVDFLTEHDLLVLTPIPDLSQSVEAKLKAGDSGESLLKFINDQVDSKISVNSLTALVTGHVFGRVLADKTKANLAELSAFKPLLTRILDDDQSQMESLFIVMNVWFKQGAPKGLIKEVFNALLETEIIDVEAFFLWRDDTKQKGAAKTKALLQVNGWITDLTPRRKVEEPEEYSDAEDDEEFDEDEEDFDDL